MVALVGDAELDEGNIFESILDGWKQGVRNCWWIIDYNRQSLDAVVREGLWERYEALFRAFGWEVVILKYGSLLEGWKHDVRDLWWVIDYNRQSLDAVVSDRLFGRIDAMFEMMGWRVVTLKYGRLLEAAFTRPDGHHLREWIDACPNSLYSALVYKGGEGWREHLTATSTAIPGSARSSTTTTMPRCSG